MMSIVQTRPEKVGDTYRYVADTNYRVVRSGTVAEGVQHLAFSIEVLKVEAATLTLRYIQTGATDSTIGPNDPRRLSSAVWAGVPVEVETERSGFPRRILNEAAVKAAIIANAAALVPNDPSIPAALQQQTDSVSPAVFLDHAVPKLGALGAMQPRGLVPLRLITMPAEPHQDAGGEVVVHKTEEIALAAGPPCRLKVTRKTWTERPNGGMAASSSLTTDATVEEGDGWVDDLTEVSRTTIPNAESVSTLKITRVRSGGCPHP